MAVLMSIHSRLCDSPLKTNADDPNTDIPLNQDQYTLSREQLLSEQNKDPDTIQHSKRALSHEEASKVRVLLDKRRGPYAKMATT
jgi:hypothetical protein